MDKDITRAVLARTAQDRIIPQEEWADEQEGPDLYELVFRPKADEILNSINQDYWLYRK